MLKVASYPVINGGISPSGYIENYKKEGIISYITLPVLDKFTELTAREAQYDYYRNMLLIDQWNDKNTNLENAEVIQTTVGDIIERRSEKSQK